jgi:NADPH:quinone reductase-like Zn-dependent oxidoreductase/acyl carrier protein
VTRGAQSVASEDAAPALTHAPLIGLARTIARGHPDLRCKLIDLDPSPEADTTRHLLEEILADDDEQEVAFRDGSRLVARLARSAACSAGPDAPVSTGAARPVRLEIAQPGNLDGLVLRSAARRRPGRGEIEIQVRAAGLNFKDVLGALDLYPGDPGPLGQECVGTVVATGEGVVQHRPGDEVLALAPGSFASFVVTRADLAVRKPSGLSAGDAATVPVAFTTAYYALHQLGRLQRGERILIHAAAGGVGMAAVQLAQRAGAEIVVTAGSAEKREYLRSLGIQHVMDSRSTGYAAEIRALTGGEGVDVVLNSLTGEHITESLSALKDGGRFLEIGKRGIWDADRVRALGRDIVYHPIYLAALYDDDPALVQAMLGTLAEELAARRLQPLPARVFTFGRAADAFRHMARAAHIGKIVLDLDAVAPAAGMTERPVSADATYLITGGLGGLGLTTAEWIVEQGGRHLVLVGRHPPDTAAAGRLAPLRESGAEIVVEQADVAQREQIARVLDRIADTMPPLRGIVHAAGVLDDGMLLQQDRSRFARVMAPKVAGSWHVHTLTVHQPLDFFVLFSAGAAVLGLPGQGGYSAANTFVDALAHYRRARGLTALSINWGPWTSVGMAAAMDQRARDRFAEMGLGSITPTLGKQILTELVRRDAPQVAVLPMDWSAYAGSLNPAPVGSLFADLVQTARPADRPASTDPAQPTLVARLAAAPASLRRNIILAHVREHVGVVMGLEAARAVDQRQPLRELGLDSLMAVELRTSLSASLGVPLPTTLAFDHPSIAALADFLISGPLAPRPDVAGTPAELDGPSCVQQEDAVRELEQLSDDDAAALLLAELAQGRNGV